MRIPTLLPALLLVAVAWAGCVEEEPPPEDPAEPEPEPEPLPAPKLLLSHNQTASSLGKASSPFVRKVMVEDGFDELVFGFEASGPGRYQVEVADQNGTTIHDSKDQISTSEPDSHSTSPRPRVFNVESGNFTLTVNWEGAITFHASLTARNHEWLHQNDHDHTH